MLKKTSKKLIHCSFKIKIDYYIVDAIEHLKKMRTIDFTILKSCRPDDIKNFKWVE